MEVSEMRRSISLLLAFVPAGNTTVLPKLVAEIWECDEVAKKLNERQTRQIQSELCNCTTFIDQLPGSSSTCRTCREVSCAIRDY